MATAAVGGPTGTSTRTDAPGAGAWPEIRARTRAFRVVGSTRASTAAIRAVVGLSPANTVTDWPGRNPAATAWATVKSTLAAASTPWSVVSSVPSFRYWPGCTSVSPTRARNGAGALDLRERDVARGSCLVHLFLRHGLRLKQALEARERGRRQIGLGGLGVELRLLHRHVEPHEHRAGLDHLSGHQRDLANRARELVTQGDGLEREHRAHRRRRRPVLAFFGYRDVHRFDRLGLPRGGRAGSAGGRGLPRGQRHPGHEHRPDQRH